ncbi:MAG: integral rane sensor hybrid histidine kinase [Sphingomonas bacterium]|nr:integral rane sensor hybrid histidine kinase [Sphingomonas bacterium]
MAEIEIGAGEEFESARSWRLWLAGAAALIAAALLIALVILVGSSSSDRDANLERERRSYDVMIVARGLDASLARSEAALGRFVISGDRSTGNLYSREWQRGGRFLARLASLTADNAEQMARVEELRTLYQARGKELAAPALRANYRQGWSALSLFNEAGKSSTIPRIARLLKDIADSERRILVGRAEETARATARANSLAGLLSVLGLLLAVGAAALGWGILHALAQGRMADRAAQLEASRADTLEEAVAARTRELRDANAQLRTEAETRAAAEAQLRQAQKMDAVGQLTGGIAHDFNNMLAVVVGGLDLARRRLGHDVTDAGRHIDNAMEGAHRAAALTRRLLAFSRAETLLPEAIAPAALVSGMVDLIDRTLGERISVETRIEAGQWQVWCDPGQLENAILNLAVNARDAMDGEGRLILSIADVTLRAGEIGEARAGEHVRISIRDEGCGMTPEIMERVFEPFFTTKPVGKGTGLGLSQVFGFVRQSEGEVMIESVPGAGTTVSLYLPRHIPDAAPAPTPTDDNAADAASAAATILVVEDDPRVLGATVSALAELGHRPIASASGAEAIACLAERDDIRLILTDVVMPEMTGPELIEAVAPLYPHIAVLYVTGYAGEAGDAGLLAGRAVLHKPFTLRALATAVAAALARPVSAPRPSATTAAAG